MIKLAKNTYPAGHFANDFRAFGPVTTKDTDFTGCRMSDLGCFNQDNEVDSNKYYHLAVVQSTKDNKWFAYFEWGRTRPNQRPDKPNFQFHECSSESEAIKVCADQFHDKNTKRGMWEKIGSKERFVSKPGKDCYVVRPTASRLVGLPCAENIANEDAKGAKATTPTPVANKPNNKKPSRQLDPQTYSLFKDLMGGAVSYANYMMTGKLNSKSALPTQHALDEARDILDDAMTCVKRIGSNVDAQIKDTELRKLSSNLYGRVPKHKPIGAADSTWILSQDNIAAWKLDIDAFETALQAVSMDLDEDSVDDGQDVMAGIPAKVYWVDPKDSLYQYLVGNMVGNKHKGWWPNSTRYRSGTGNAPLKVHNLWVVERDNDRKNMRHAQEMISGEMPKSWNNERAMFDDTRNRPDLNPVERKLFMDSNTSLLFHGSRSVNIPGIIRENLRFPKELTGVAITGACFGPGSYFADDWSKSAGYCSSPNSLYAGSGGSVKGRKSFMFAFDVCLGHPHVAPHPRGYAGPPPRHHCVFGKANHSGVVNNEWIIFHKGRIEIRYLAEVSW